MPRIFTDAELLDAILDGPDATDRLITEMAVEGAIYGQVLIERPATDT